MLCCCCPINPDSQCLLTGNVMCVCIAFAIGDLSGKTKILSELKKNGSTQTEERHEEWHETRILKWKKKFAAWKTKNKRLLFFVSVSLVCVCVIVIITCSTNALNAYMNIHSVFARSFRLPPTIAITCKTAHVHTHKHILLLLMNFLPFSARMTKKAKPFKMNQQIHSHFSSDTLSLLFLFIHVVPLSPFLTLSISSLLVSNWICWRISWQCFFNNMCVCVRVIMFCWFYCLKANPSFCFVGYCNGAPWRFLFFDCCCCSAVRFVISVFQLWACVKQLIYLQ